METPNDILSFVKDVTIPKATYINMLDAMSENADHRKFFTEKGLWTDFYEFKKNQDAQI